VSEQTTNRYFDKLAIGLSSGKISRGKALKLMGATLVGGTLASLGIGGEAAAAECKLGGRSCKENTECCGGYCDNGTCRGCSSPYVELKNGTCAYPCGTSPSDYLFSDGGCYSADSGGAYCSCGGNQGLCRTDKDCPVNYFCSSGVCIQA
jgi:hypothetical protein